jgi:hypothetical protein
VKVRFRGNVQTKNNIPDYSRVLNLEPIVANLPDDPGSDWRYGLIAVTGNATATGGTVTARYSSLMRASDNNPDIAMSLQREEEQVYLVVAATPTKHHKISWDQFYYTIYRFPYMVEITGAKPEGFQPISNPVGAFHSNGGGFVQAGATVDATAYVGPYARVLGTAQVRNNARIEGHAVVKGNAQVRENAIVKDYALVAGGSVYGSAVVAEGANIWNAQIYGNALINGAPNIYHANAKIYGNTRVGGVVWIDQPLDLSGTAQLLGDGEIYNITATKGVFFGLVDASTITDNQQGASRTAEPAEVTAPRSMTWVDPSSSSVGPTGIQNIAAKGAEWFHLNKHGIFTYNLGNFASAKLKIFDSSGKLLKTIRLNERQGTVDTQINTTRILFWKVEKHLH